MRVARVQCAKTERDAAKLRNLVRNTLAGVYADRSSTKIIRSRVVSQLDRLQADKKQLEAQAIANRDYAHKMEQRFFLGTKAQVRHLVSIATRFPIQPFITFMFQ